MHHLRVDRLRTDPSSGASGSAKFDPKRTVFIGQLHFEAKEEELRSFFASKVSGGDGAIEGIRIVRDPATLKGKGIAYCLFASRTHVAEALGANGQSFRGRNLRVTRCIDTEKAAANPTYRATHAAGLPQLSAAAAAKKRLFSKTSAGRRDAERAAAKASSGGTGSSSSSSSAAPVAASSSSSSSSSSSRPSFMGARGEEVVLDKVAMKAGAQHRKKQKHFKAKEERKQKHQQRKEGGGGGGGGAKPAFNSKGEKVKGILKKKA